MNRIGEGSQDPWPEKILHEFQSKTTIFGLHFHSLSQLIYACDDPMRYVIIFVSQMWNIGSQMRDYDSKT